LTLRLQSAHAIIHRPKEQKMSKLREDSELEKLLGKAPECIHDYSKAVVDTDNLDGPVFRTRVMHCGTCGELLKDEAWSRRPHTAQVIVEQTSYNEVYELLYTRKGRLRIVIAALKDAGWKVPKFWREEEE
jgi:hypothetical protein